MNIETIVVVVVVVIVIIIIVIIIVVIINTQLQSRKTDLNHETISYLNRFCLQKSGSQYNGNSISNAW
jgi:type II secretory pathway pseudopilin PulG